MVVDSGIVMGPAAAEIGGDPARIVAIGENGGVTFGCEQIAPLFELGDEPIGDDVVRPESAGSVKHDDGRVGTIAVDVRIGKVEPGGQGELVGVGGVAG